MDKNNLKLEFENNPSKNYIVTYLNDIDCIIDYEVEMINNNPTSGALNIEIRQFNDRIKILYDATGRIPVKEYLKGRTIRKSEFITILKNMAVCLLECKNYFLDEKKFFMDLGTIFINEKDLSINLLYLPFNISNEEDINITYRNLIKSLIIDFVTVEEKNSENIIQETLKYLRKEDFTLVGFKNYLEESERSSVNASSGEVNKVEDKIELPEVTVEKEEISDINMNRVSIVENINADHEKEVNNEVEVSKINDTPKVEEIKPERKSKARSSKILKIIFTAIFQLVSIGIIAVEAIFIPNILIKILSIVLVVILDGALTTFIWLRGRNKVETVADKRKANTSYIVKGKEDKKSKPSKREIVTEMSYETELLDVKTAFLMSKKAGTVERIFINKDCFKIGRVSGQVDYISDNKAVGKIHAEIRKQGEKYYLIDLNSKNGTFVNGRKINSDELYEIRNGDTIIFANSEFTFAIE
ncbi:DUF6382 domain-containing protein [Clostridium felsineum]|uniref:Uncharacterized protein n=1 Tax=Clostridium felsineum TaxID=36839 RepID=A0A1S8KYR1_9CLOT|nr:DUF6382 domain-containing protein [Clostridium felsineum]URZ07806.1 hypothetical protein CLROS_031670 [Clostridium felsineum]URZ12837.1 hypothetical protein CROST_035820 [Clostridium felsineum]